MSAAIEFRWVGLPMLGLFVPVDVVVCMRAIRKVVAHSFSLLASCFSYMYVYERKL